MSFGDPNNPYGAPQGQPPGYGHPQQPGQPSYGYPSAPPMQPYGQPVPPVVMPGGVKAARVMLYVLGGFQVLGGVLMMAASAWFADYFEDIASSEPNISAEDADTVADIGAGVMIALGVIVLAFAFWAIFTAAKFAKGRGGVRVSAIVYASLVTLFSVLSLLGTNIFALISLVLGILIIVFCANRNGGYWFNRPQY
ncbi:proline-rich domain-containing protein [Streptomyces sp. NPDC017966]|uniref:proline-rich domain-containing protein n=1 Tax=Streptomyces sp. NPDC017966 TaxID=3365023 RepID=UPI003788C72B